MPRDEKLIPVGTPCIGAFLDVNTLGECSFFEIPLWPDFASRGVPWARRYAAVSGALGCLRCLVNLSTGERAEYSYDAWGRFSVSDGTSEGVGAANRLLYKGYYYDDFLRAYLLGRRVYDPRLCRFWQPDSATHADPEEIGGLNPYVYCLNDPLVYADPTGRFPVTALIVSTLLGMLLAAGEEFVRQTYKGDLFGIFDSNN
ncbi:MAG: RHS repeat-associated core domain-containing protein [Bacilli bacterium]|nr:RHS repeat-associated core domain-containing protein [Bacilli bacterium]